MVKLSRQLALPLLTAVLCGCDDGPSGVEQRVVELEARLSAKESEVMDLRTKLDEARKTKPSGETPATDTPANTRAGVYAAATVLAESLKDQVKPRSLSVSGEVAYAGFTTKGADGVERGVAVPFFRDGESSSWQSGWSAAQIVAALGEVPAVASTTSSTQSSVATTQAPMAEQSPPPSIPAPAAPPTPAPAPASTLPGLPPRWSYDSATSEVVAPNGARMPPAPAGWKYGMMEGAAGDTPRAYIQSPQGQRKYYVE